MVNPLRIRKLSTTEYSGGTVIYQMCRDLRAHDNDALLYAIQLAESKKEKIIVNYVIYNYLWEGATRRFYDWVLASLKEVEATLRSHNIPLVVTFEHKKLFEPHEKNEIPSHIGAVVIDQLPLSFMRQWKSNFLTLHPEMPLYEVDAHNCIPVWELTNKQEFAARTIRPKVYAKISDFLEPFDALKKYNHNGDILETIKPVDWEDVTKKIICNEVAIGVDWAHGGEKEAKRALKNFLENKLDDYDEGRNNYNIEGQSNLSPYIAHGNIARRSIVLAVLERTGRAITSILDEKQNGSNGKLGSISAFIEELVVRAELSDNFCFYNKKYGSVDGFPEWAKKELVKTKSDKREYTYSTKEFEEARTHDDLWNAAQKQMVKHGKMHGYLRMYWAKKILEWSASSEDALRTAIYLNDTYELDGRDPNGYVGCAWSIGGLHDRPWFSRPIFGSIRYMATSGVEKRGDTKQYINKWNQ
jgi:deoxyribodipyrimidine photo-lyase